LLLTSGFPDFTDFSDYFRTMMYRVIGLMSGSSLDGLDIVFAELHVTAGKWNFEIVAADTYAYDKTWENKLKSATNLSAYEYQALHTAYGHYLGEQVARFIDANNLHYKVALISSHGHTTFHAPHLRMTAQLGDGAAIAAVTGLPVVSDLRALDVAFGGQGAPIVPMGEKLLFPEYDLLLNIGGIANLSIKKENSYAAFDICAANRVLNALAEKEGRAFDDGGSMAASGSINEALLAQLAALDYYKQPPPKSLANSFGTHTVLPLIQQFNLATADALRTYVAHIVDQIKMAIANSEVRDLRMLVTGGGAFNTFLISELQSALQPYGIEVAVPDAAIVNYKEALIMALLGVLRWRQEATVLSSVTGATRDSIGGAVWIGQEA
jgi:anhydro-N-acetylmuramic acid kinase